MLGSELPSFDERKSYPPPFDYCTTYQTDVRPLRQSTVAASSSSSSSSSSTVDAGSQHYWLYHTPLITATTAAPHPTTVPIAATTTARVHHHCAATQPLLRQQPAHSSGVNLQWVTLSLKSLSPTTAMGTPSRPARAVLGERTTNAVNTAIPSSTLSNTATFQPPVIVRLHPVRPVSHSPNVLQPPRSPPTSKQNENRPPTHSPQQPYYTDTAHKAALQASLSPVKHSAVRRSSHHSSPYALPVGGDEDSVSDNRRLSFNRPTERVLHIHSIDDRESLARLSEGPPAVQAPAPSFRYSLRSSYRPYQWTANKSAVSGRPSFANYYAPPVPAELSPALPPSPSSQHESPVELLTEPESPPAPTQHLTASEHGSLHKRQLSSHKRPLPPRHVPRSAGAFNTAVSQSPLLSPAIGRSPSSAPRPLPYYRPPSLASVTPALPSAPHNKEDDSEQKDVQPQADSSHWQSSSRSLSSSVAAVEAANDVHLSLGIGSAASMSFQTFVGSNEYGMYEREVVNNVDLLRRSNALNDETADYCLLLEPDRQEQAVDEQQQQQQQQQPADEVEMYIRQIECQNSNTLTDALDPEAALKTPDRRAAVAAAVSPTSPSSPTSAPKRRQQLNSPLPTFLFSDLSRRFSSHYQLQAGQSNSAYITQRLLDAGLSVKEDRLRLGGKVLLCVGASAGRLEAEAEKMKLRLRVKGGGWSKFDRTMRDQFVGSGDAADMFRSSERQIIIDHIIRTKQAEGGAGLDDKYASIIADRFPLHMYARLQSLQPWLRYWQLQRHSKSRLPSISSLLSQPLDAISAYFGEGVAFYFAFLGFYTLWLLVPTVLGAVLFVSQLSHTSLDSPLVPFFCVLMSLWASFFIEYWRRRQAVLSNRWGTWQLAANDEELMRPEYRGALKRHEVTGELTREYPLRKRVKKVSVAVLLCFVIVAGFSTLILNLFVQQDKYFGTDTTDVSTPHH